MRAGSRGRGSPRKSWPTRSFTPTISPASGENVIGSIHMSCARSGAPLSAIAIAVMSSFTGHLLGRRPQGLRLRAVEELLNVGVGNRRHGAVVGTAVALQQTLMRW